VDDLTPRLKVLFLAQHLTMGGAEQLLLGLATHLPRERFEVVVGCLTREGLIARELRQAGVRVELLPGEPGLRDPSAFVRLVRFIRRERPDVVHTFLLSAGLYGRLAAWLAGAPAIYHAEQNIYTRKSRRHLLFERLLARRTDRVVACCQAVGEHYQRQVGLDPRRLEVIYNAIDFAPIEPRAARAAARAELGYGPADLVLGGLGRLTEQKGQDLLLKALASLAPRWNNLKLFLAGEGSERAALEQQATQLGLADRVRFLGVRRDRATLFAALDLFVLPSRWEGLSLALVEAAGVGLPILATDVGGNREVVEGEHGIWLVPPHDVWALAAALDAAFPAVERWRDGEIHPPCPRPALRERFSLTNHVQQLEASYRAVLGRQLVAQPDGVT
jgi:glycosyltransferase involved in cell wall biosynthesis